MNCNLLRMRGLQWMSICMYKYAATCRNVLCTHASMFVCGRGIVRRSISPQERVYLQLWGVCGRARGFVCASRGPDGLLREGIMRHAGSVAAGWGGSLNGTEVWEADTHHSSHTFLTERPASALQLDTTTVCVWQREESYYGTRAFIPLNDERVYGGMKASHSLNYQCHLSGWVTVESLRSWRKQKVSLQKNPKNIWHMVSIDIVDDLSVEKIFFVSVQMSKTK